MKYALLFLLLLPSVAALEWSEIMFDPTGNDNGKEFIELHGNEPLNGCTISDTASSDVLALNRSGNDIILIVETGHLIDVMDATVYTAGSAIGNGLGNTYEKITITCEGFNISTSYNSSNMKIPAGASIVFHDDWSAGTVNGTPGVIEEIPKDNLTTTEPTTPTTSAPAIPCNNTLLVIAPMTAIEGENVQFTIIAAGYAYYDIISDGELIDVGDTLNENHSFTAHGKTKIVAHAEYCGGTQRAARTITATARNVTTEVRAELGASIASPKTRTSVEQPEAPITPDQSLEQTALASEKGEPPLATAAVVMDDNRDALPWISAFGMVTIITSAIIFLQLLRREDRQPSSEDEGKVYKDGRGTPRHEGKPDQGTSLKGLDPRDRDI